MTDAIELSALRREYGGRSPVVALDGIDLAVPRGQVVALLGENGAGKTTLVKILATLLLPSAGTARVLGHDVARDAHRVREVTGLILGGDRGLYGTLSARNNLRYFGVLAGAGRRELRRRVPELLDDVGLGETAARRVETFSKGMKQRLHIAIGLVTRPPVLLLDEPTVGLDPTEAERLRRVVAEQRDADTTVLLTSHNLIDIDRLADRVVMISHGRLTHDMPLREFAGLVGYQAVATLVLAGRANVPGEQVEFDGERTTVRVRVREWSPAVLGELAALARGHELLDMSVREVSLDEAFAIAAKVGMA